MLYGLFGLYAENYFIVIVLLGILEVIDIFLLNVFFAEPPPLHRRFVWIDGLILYRDDGTFGIILLLLLYKVLNRAPLMQLLISV